MFECKSGECINKTLVCNSNYDCDDNSDEECCGDMFKCANGGCIRSSWTCDDEDDCGDNSDESEEKCGMYVHVVIEFFNNSDAILNFEHIAMHCGLSRVILLF